MNRFPSLAVRGTARFANTEARCVGGRRRQKGLSPKNVRDIALTLRKASSDAVADGLLRATASAWLGLDRSLRS